MSEPRDSEALPRWLTLRWVLPVIVLLTLNFSAYLVSRGSLHELDEIARRSESNAGRCTLLLRTSWLVGRLDASAPDGDAIRLELASAARRLRNESATWEDVDAVELERYAAGLDQYARGNVDARGSRVVARVLEPDGLIGRLERVIESDLTRHALLVARQSDFEGLVLLLNIVALVASAVFLLWPLERGLRAGFASALQARRRAEEHASARERTIEHLESLRSSERQRSLAMASIAEDLERERRNLNREMRERESVEEFSLVALEAAPNGMLMIDSEGRILLVNSQIEELFGYSRQEVLGQFIEVLLPERYRSAHPAQRNEYFMSPVPRPMGAGRELVARRKDGSEFPVEIGLNPVHTAEGVRVLGSVVDVTERHRAEAEIADYHQALGVKNRELEEILYIISHDLKSPLVTAQGFAGRLARYLSEGNHDRADDAARRVLRATTRMGSLLDDFLQLSRVGRVDEEREPVDVDALVRDLEEAFAERLSQAGARLVVEGRLPGIRSNRAMLVQVFQNLIGNALEYACREPGGVITVGHELRRKHGVAYFVRDTGPGIDPRYHQTVFKLFQRLDFEKEGTGLGLAIVERIMEHCGGSVRLESELGEGATFWLEFTEALLPDEVVTT